MNHNWVTTGPSSVENQPGVVQTSAGVPNYGGPMRTTGLNATNVSTPVRVSPFITDATSDLAQSTFFHFYFGKNQGNTAYDNFITKFIPPDETDE